MVTTFDYYIFYKPYQVLTQFSPEKNKKTLSSFFSNIAKDVYPVGRLDYDSEGLLLLTNDKRLNHRLLNPLFIHEREYWAQVEGVPSADALNKLRNGVTISIDGKPYRTQKAMAQLIHQEPELPERIPPIRFRKNIPASWLSLCITEGKNRQVRRMTAAVGLPTLRLVRYRIGAVTIAGMEPGTIIQTGADIKERLFRRTYIR